MSGKDEDPWLHGDGDPPWHVRLVSWLVVLGLVAAILAGALLPLLV